jgi:isochorismate synthase
MNAFNLLDQTTSVEFDEQIELGVYQARNTGLPTLVSVSIPWQIASDTYSPIALFEAAATFAEDRHYWSPPGEKMTLVGVGCAWATESLCSKDKVTISRFRSAAEAWARLTTHAVVPASSPTLRGVGPMLLGGFSFDALRKPTPLWTGFPAGRLVLPRLLFTFLEDQSWITLNSVVMPTTVAAEEVGNLLTLRQQLLHHHPTNGHFGAGRRPVLLQREIRPAQDWKADVSRAADTIRAGKLEKVVLARAVELQATLPFEAGPALRWLSDNYTGCYVFAIGHGARCFLGATPERLVRLQGGEIMTMSLAGSIKRGATPDEDNRLGTALLDSAKDRQEHTVVVQSIKEALDEHCSSLTIRAKPSLLKLSNIQHICTTIRGELAMGRTLFDVVEALHPTPAVGGRPRDASLALIRECEKLDRGWYAGPVGWVDSAGDGEFAVALRSALLEAHTATLFAGCGIVADSNAEREYAESVLKLKPMLAALGL